MIKKTIDAQWLDSHFWCLRSTSAGVSYNDFVWPPLGEWAESPDWDPSPVSGGGLHGNFPGHAGFGFCHSQIELCEADRATFVSLGNKGKCKRMRRVAVGVEIPPEAFARCGFRAISDDGIYRIDNGIAIVLAGKSIINHSGGYISTHGTSTPTINQSGGDIFTHGTSTPTINRLQKQKVGS